uniref:Fatty acyl-CoA reductase n=1 Tax=Steinernema glaseri TaxID=37863 RepID=A0A1I7ZTN2_9BILA
MESRRRVADTFTGRSIFVTGFTGFLGKVLVEKLLWSFPDIKNVFVLVRDRRGVAPKERVQKLLESPIYNRLRLRDSSIFQKIVPLSGNLMEEELGLNELDMRRLCDEVSIVFHCAATVKFDEVLRVSVEMNVLGTQRLIALCHKMGNLIAVVHASTAYANCDKPETEESVYPPPVHPGKLIDSFEWMNDGMINKLTPMLLDKRPNTYTFTKALAEMQLVEDARQLPVIIVRPSIIGAMWKDPLPGWTDNLNGPTGIFAACGKGLITNMCGSTASVADIIPVDVVSNMIIVAASHRANKKYDYIPVMHCSSGVLNPLKWERIVNYLQRFYHNYPLDSCYGVPSTHFHSSRKLFLLNYYVKHHYPAQALDLFARLTGRDQMFVRMYSKIWKMIETLHFFTTRGWTFQAKGLLTLWDDLSDEDKKIFNFDIRQVDWDRYLFDYLMGIKVYLLGEKLDNLPKARSNLFRLKLLSTGVNAGFWGLMVRYFAAKKTKNQKWIIWLTGFLATYFFQNVNFRPAVQLKSLSEYKRSAQQA